MYYYNYKELNCLIVNFIYLLFFLEKLFFYDVGRRNLIDRNGRLIIAIQSSMNNVFRKIKICQFNSTISDRQKLLEFPVGLSN